MKTTILEEQVCPHCGHILDAHSAKENAPNPGDISICFYCGGVNTYSKYLSLIKCTDEYLESLEETIKEDIKKIQKLIKKNS